MTMEIRFHQEESMKEEWAGALFWDCKNSPSLYGMDHKCPCVLALELFDVSGLSWLIKEINRLKLDVLT